MFKVHLPWFKKHQLKIILPKKKNKKKTMIIYVIKISTWFQNISNSLTHISNKFKLMHNCLPVYKCWLRMRTNRICLSLYLKQIPKRNNHKHNFYFVIICIYNLHITNYLIESDGICFIWRILFKSDLKKLYTYNLLRYMCMYKKRTIKLFAN